MDRRQFERRIMAGLLILLSVEISLLVLHLAWGGFRPHRNNAKTPLAGEVLASEHELRRRSLNSLVWEKSSTNDPLYYYDSVLTLSQSTASLKLYRDTDLRLSENTLVTIEPPSDDRHGEIRLLFHKGGFKARNPYAKTQVKGDNWSMEIKTGSEVDLRQVGTENYELQVTKGEVGFKSETGNKTLSKDEVLRIDPKSSQQIQILPEESLHWIDPPAKRIYTHKPDVSATLKWEGIHPTQLLRQTLGGEEAITPLGPEATEITLTLPTGHHSFYLRTETQTSQALDVEVWTAPLVHLLTPLPRNRIKTGAPVSFVWTSRPEIANFHFLLKGRETKIDQFQSDNILTTQFENEDDAEWRIEAVDKDGFVIPAPYSYPIFIREAPLAAPSLKSPIIRKPAKTEDEGASFWMQLGEWLLPTAHAENVYAYQAVFSWEPVEKADRYVIEISETPDFRTPLVTQTIEKNEYSWRHVELKTYYWRVAAESKRGLMGFFSEPQKADLRNAQTENVKVTKIKKEAPIAATPPPPPPPKEEPPPIEEPKRNTYRLEWRPRYTSMSSTASDDVTAKLQGMLPLDFGFHTDLRSGPGRSYRIDIEYANIQYQPNPKSDFPAQSDLSWSDIRASGKMHFDSEIWGYGLSVRTATQFSRESDSSITAKPGLMLGPTLENWHKWQDLEYYGVYGVLIGPEYGGSVEQHLIHSFGRFVIGGNVELNYFIHSGGNTTSLTGQLTLGFQF